MLVVALARCDDSPTGLTEPDSDTQAGGGPAPVACFTTEPNPPEIAALEKVVLDAGCSTNVGSVASYEWDLGDGRSATGPRVEARYRRPGEFTVRLRLRDRDVMSEATARIAVRQRPNACFVFHQILATESEEPCTMVFDATCSSGPVKEYRWLFEGGVRTGDPPPAPQDAAVTTTEPHIVHSWRDEIECFAFRPFERLVRLTVVDEGGATDTNEETVQFAVPMLRR
jgi:hypothetical protein